ncbi:MAG TPA: pyruvate dehydrogenase (acetyl-transferring), homodimeric type, partial [Thermoanaerobaculia bacterium]
MSIDYRAPLDGNSSGRVDIDVAETAEWIEALNDVVEIHGPDRGEFLLAKLIENGRQHELALPVAGPTAYVNTIPLSREPAYPGDRAIERRLKSLMRWNAMAMVV